MKDISSKLGLYDMMDLGYDKSNWNKVFFGSNYIRFVELYFLIFYCVIVFFIVRLIRFRNIFKIV